MKKRLLYGAIICGMMAIVLIACKKTASDIPPNPSIAQINNLLSIQKSPRQPNKGAYVNQLMKNLDYAHMTQEYSEGEHETLLIVPIGNEFKDSWHFDSRSVLNLVAVVNATGTIRKVNIVMFTPEQNQPTIDALPYNTLNSVLNTGDKVAVNGQFKFLTVGGKWIYQLDYKDGKLAAEGIVKKGDKAASGNVGANSVNPVRSDNANCTDWYLVTTFHYNDGSSATTSEFLGTTCIGCDLNPNVPMGLCDDGFGAGNNEEYEYFSVNDQEWFVASTYSDTVTTGGLTIGSGVNSVERLRGKKVSTEPQGGHFTSLVHNNDGCNDSGALWAATSVTSSVSSQSAAVRIQGHWTKAGLYHSVDNSRTFSFSQIFP
jgi:hypothetical protein